MKAAITYPAGWSLLNLLATPRLVLRRGRDTSENGSQVRPGQWPPRFGQGNGNEEAASVTETPIPPQLWPSY
jgi:hypothetical protein